MCDITETSATVRHNHEGCLKHAEVHCVGGDFLFFMHVGRLNRIVLSRCLHKLKSAKAAAPTRMIAFTSGHPQETSIFHGLNLTTPAPFRAHENYQNHYNIICLNR